ncbi:hypothetical protein SLS62_007780 [Diatrype stigma]|uniref:Lipid droplet-associated hydrolase n=1 Tax=Diatrype stigma TaxID=117547 RepID=A0AAN9UYP6_9PEZI
MPLHTISYHPKPISNGDATTDKTRSRDVLIYFIPGNPGLIDYYAPFLAHLWELLDSATAAGSSSSLPPSTRFHIYGQDLAGFSDDGHEPFTSKRKPFDLEHQIQLTLRTVESMRVVEARGSDGDGDDLQESSRCYDEVILMGHSVGSYIALQLCHRSLSRLQQEREREREPEHHISGHGPKLDRGILLFPTIVHIARSPAGRRLDTLRRTPGLGANAYRLARLLLAPWPRGALRWFARAVMGFPAHAAEATARWLGSRGGDGVWQALHMGMDEMQVIGDDVWDEELWGIEREAEAEAEADQQGQQVPSPRFYFFFGKNDHWVADHYRDMFIEKRQKQIERTKLIVDEGDLPHAFCIRHSETVAEKVYTWVQEMYIDS